MWLDSQGLQTLTVIADVTSHSDPSLSAYQPDLLLITNNQIQVQNPPITVYRSPARSPITGLTKSLLEHQDPGRHFIKELTPFPFSGFAYQS